LNKLSHDWGAFGYIAAFSRFRAAVVEA